MPQTIAIGVYRVGHGDDTLVVSRGSAKGCCVVLTGVLATLFSLGPVCGNLLPAATLKLPENIATDGKQHEHADQPALHRLPRHL